MFVLERWKPNVSAGAALEKSGCAKARRRASDVTSTKSVAANRHGPVCSQSGGTPVTPARAMNQRYACRRAGPVCCPSAKPSKMKASSS